MLKLHLNNIYVILDLQQDVAAVANYAAVCGTYYATASNHTNHLSQEIVSCRFFSFIRCRCTIYKGNVKIVMEYILGIDS